MRPPRTIAIIPVKNTSERVPDKNFREFAARLSLLELKLRQIIDSKAFDHIYISSNSERAQTLAGELGVTHLWREEQFCNNLTPWSDVIVHVLESLPEDDDTVVAWCHTTSPLFERYAEALRAFQALDPREYNGLIAVRTLNAFILNQRARPLNYAWGVWHTYSQDLEQLYAVSGALFVGSRAELLKARYVVAAKPALFMLSEYESADLDTEYDFKLAQLLWANREVLKTC